MTTTTTKTLACECWQCGKTVRVPNALPLPSQQEIFCAPCRRACTPKAPKAPTKAEKRSAAAALRTKVEGLIAVYRAGQNATDGNLISLACLASSEAMEIADRLSLEIAACPFNDLLAKWTAHGYRPTLRADTHVDALTLADLYDFVAQVRGLDVQAYRG